MWYHKKEQIDTQLGWQQLEWVLDQECVNKHDLVTTPDIADSSSPDRLMLLPTPSSLIWTCQSGVLQTFGDINLRLLCLILLLSLTG